MTIWMRSVLIPLLIFPLREQKPYERFRWHSDEDHRCIK